MARRSPLWHLPLLAGTLALGLTAFGCDGRPRNAEVEDEASVGEDHVAEIDLRGGAPELSNPSLFASSRPTSFADLVLRLRTMPDEPHLKGVLVRIGAGLSLARTEEAGRHLDVLRKKGLPVVCHAHGYSNSTMVLAARGCDQIFLSPAGGVDTIGLAGQLIFGRALLDRLNVEVDFLQVGKFKGAKEPFTNTSASPEARQSLQTALSGLREGWLDAIETGRDNKRDALGIEDGPHTAEEAKALGLIDEIGGLNRAIDLAIELAKLDAATPIEIIRSDQSLFGLLGVEGAQAKAAAVKDLERRAGERAREVLSGGLLPFRDEIVAFEASTTPLVQGERLIVALPYVLAVR